MKLVIRFVGVTLLALALAACHGPSNKAGSISTMQLKLYKVPVQQSSAIQQSLWDVLAGSTAGGDGKGSNSGMRVTQPFPGTLMVLAPESIQDSVGSAIAALDKASVKVAVPEQMEVHFWMVAATPGEASNSPSLKPLAATLDKIRASLGPSYFTLDEAVTATATLNQRAEIITGAGHKFFFKATPGQGASIDLLVEYNDGHPDKRGVSNLHTTVAITPGQYIVLAQAPDASPGAQPGHGSSPRAPSIRLLVVRVDRIAPPSH